jgi:hypothetical protein
VLQASAAGAIGARRLIHNQFLMEDPIMRNVAPLLGIAGVLCGSVLLAGCKQQAPAANSAQPTDPSKQTQNQSPGNGKRMHASGGDAPASGAPAPN